MLYMPRNTKSFGAKEIKGGVIQYGDKHLTLVRRGRVVAYAVLIEGDSALKEDGLTYALSFLVGCDEKYVGVITNFIWELMDAVVTHDEILGYLYTDKWNVVSKKGAELTAPIVCENYRKLERLPNGNPLGNTTEATVKPLRASEWVSNDTEGTPDKATHYKGAVEPLEVMAKLLNKDEFIGFLKGNIIKYSYRAGRKQGESGEKDRNKFLVYSDWLHKVTNGEPIVLGDKTITFN